MKMLLKKSAWLLLGMTAACVAAAEQRPAAAASAPPVPAPLADHHQHVRSEDASRLFILSPSLEPVALPAPLAQLLEARTAAWNRPEALAALYKEDAVALGGMAPTWVGGRGAVVQHLAGRFSRPYRMVPVRYGAGDSAAWVAGYYVRGEGPAGQRLGEFVLTFAKEGGAWKIAAEEPHFPLARIEPQMNAEAIIAQLDDAGIRKGLLLSVGYWFASPFGAPLADEPERVRRENDWTIAEAARHPGRLVAFCSVNPLRDYAAAELGRCASAGVKGVKIHLGNSRADLRRPEHAHKLRAFFAAANQRRMAVVAHLWTDPSYEKEGAAHATAFLNEVLPAAPDVPVQIAHMAGGGRMTEPALAVFADAIAAGDPRTRNLWFDVATSATLETPAPELLRLAELMRRIGLERILYGSDAAHPPFNHPARQHWAIFRATMPLTPAELDQLARNVAPYMR